MEMHYTELSKEWLTLHRMGCTSFDMTIKVKTGISQKLNLRIMPTSNKQCCDDLLAGVAIGSRSRVCKQNRSVLM